MHLTLINNDKIRSFKICKNKKHFYKIYPLNAFNEFIIQIIIKYRFKKFVNLRQRLFMRGKFLFETLPYFLYLEFVKSLDLLIVDKR